MLRSFFCGLFLVLSGVVVASQMYNFIPLQSFLSGIYDVSVSEASLTSAGFLFPYAVGLLFFGNLVDRKSSRVVLLTGLVLLSAITILMGVVNSFPLLVFTRVVQGFIAATFAPSAFSYIFSNFQKRKAFLIAMVNTGFLLAGIVGQWISAWLSFSYSIQTMFVSFGWTFALCAIILSLTISKPKKTIHTQKSTTTILAFFRNPALQKLYFLTCFLLLTVMVFYGSLDLYLQKETLSKTFSIQEIRAWSLIGILPAFFIPYLEKRLGSIKLLSMSCFIMMVAFLLSGIFTTITTLFLTSVMMIASISVAIPMVVLLVGKQASEARATGISIYSFLLLSGAGIGSLLAPLLPLPSILLGETILFSFLTLVIFTLHKQKEPSLE